MRTETHRTINLKDYAPSPWLIDEVQLDVRLAPQNTRVNARFSMRPNDAVPSAPLKLDGEALELTGLAIDGVALAAGEYELDEQSLTIKTPLNQPFTLDIETTCNPDENTELSGLYRSNGIYCTQCEAEGFRRITYFLDRPDILAKYTVRIEARRSDAPVLLSNGNLLDSGEVAGTERHFAIWEDPFPKPSYLFALVGGDLASLKDTFTTMSGREVDLVIYVEPGNEDRCDWAMDSLKTSMRWDEERFGLEYDLDIFMIVAVSDFNMGAMENKGLNIFNDKYILATPQTATDMDHVNIEAIIAHEYFHNWTGNRITCRDWFQLCLKEGLTVFRDQEFTSDIRSRPVKRIADVLRLRHDQFPEDAGPLAHPVRPASYIEINNFYTATVYEKGAELCRMLQTLLGKNGFRKGMDLYFERHDGEAATVEDFISSMAEACDRDLNQFFRWYEQAGTPHVSVEGAYNEDAKTFTLIVKQETAPTPGQDEKEPQLIPLLTGLIGSNGEELVPETLLELKDSKAEFVLENVAEKPVLSVNRGFSAPIILKNNLNSDEELFLFANDADPFNRWEAGRSWARAHLAALVDQIRQGNEPSPDGALSQSFAKILAEPDLEDNYRAFLLNLPGESEIASYIVQDVDPGAIHDARKCLQAKIGGDLLSEFENLYASLASNEPYRPDPAGCGRRELRNLALAYIITGAPELGKALAAEQASSATNMTDEMAALSLLARQEGPEREAALSAFYEKNRHNHLLVDKWLGLNAMAEGEGAVDHVRSLLSHEAFSLKRPNKVRALMGMFAIGNPPAFHDPSGDGYALFAEVILELDKINPQVAARLAGALRSWKTLEQGRRGLAKAELERIKSAEKLSKDLFEIVTKTLDA
ncbi:MAG: aminopeptidase N [Hyphomicrobiales bacterium]